MADRRARGSGAGGGRDGGPGEGDYDWLYGDGDAKRSRPTPPPGEPEPTRVLPSGMGKRPGAQPRSETPVSRQPARPPAPPIAPAPRKRRRRPLRWLLLLLALWLVFLVAAPIYAWTTVSRVQHVPKAGDRPAEQPGTTYLVVGSDARAGLSGRRTDTIMLLHTGDGPNVLMSIPRDSLVEVPGYGVTKINAAFAYGGPRLLTHTVEGSTGIRIDHYVEIGFNGFVKLVDAVGGITICPKTAMRDPLAELDIAKGCQEADGKTALGYARSRKTQSLGDIDRARHQREVVSAIAGELVSWQTVVNPVRYWRTVNAGAQSVRVSKDTGPISAAGFALGMRSVDGETGLTCGVPIADLSVRWDAERAEQLFSLIREDRTDDIGKNLCRPTGMLD